MIRCSAVLAFVLTAVVQVATASLSISDFSGGTPYSICQGCLNSGQGFCPGTGMCMPAANASQCPPAAAGGYPYFQSDWGNACRVWTATTCSTCFDASGASGWCPQRQRCYYANAGWNISALCPGPDAAGYPFVPQDPDGNACRIMAAATCDACFAASSSAGWCELNHRCYYYTAGWNLTALCPGEKNGYPFFPSDPDGNACRIIAATDCSSCMQASGSAGWCAASRRCYYGDGSGPTSPAVCNSSASPATTAWLWHQSQCQQGTCSAQPSCGDCFAARERGQSCGWCETSGMCLYGSSKGADATAGTCPAANTSWYWSTCLGPCAFNISVSNVAAHTTPVDLANDATLSQPVEFNVQLSNVWNCSCVTLQWSFADGATAEAPAAMLPSGQSVLSHKFNLSAVPGWEPSVPVAQQLALLQARLVASTVNDSVTMDVAVSAFERNATLATTPMSSVVDAWVVAACTAPSAGSPATIFATWIWRRPALDVRDAAAWLNATVGSALIGALPESNITETNSDCAAVAARITSARIIGETTAEVVASVELQLSLSVADVFTTLQFSTTNAHSGPTVRAPVSHRQRHRTNLRADTSPCVASVHFNDGIDGDVKCEGTAGSSDGASAEAGVSLAVALTFPMHLDIAHGAVRSASAAVSGSLAVEADVDIAFSNHAALHFDVPAFDHHFSCHTWDIPRPCFVLVGDFPVLYRPFVSVGLEGSVAADMTMGLSASWRAGFDGAVGAQYSAAAGASFIHSADAFATAQAPALHSSCKATGNLGVKLSFGLTLEGVADVAVAVTPGASLSVFSNPTTHGWELTAGGTASVAVDASVLDHDLGSLALYDGTFDTATTGAVFPAYGCGGPGPTPPPNSQVSVEIHDFTHCGGDVEYRAPIANNTCYKSETSFYEVFLFGGSCGEGAQYAWQIFSDSSCQNMVSSGVFPFNDCVARPAQTVNNWPFTNMTCTYA